jgi:hypothetical protein
MGCAINCKMEGKNKERWMELCEQASKEQDPRRLSELVRQISQILEGKEQRLKGRLRPDARAAD